MCAPFLFFRHFPCGDHLCFTSFLSRSMNLGVGIMSTILRLSFILVRRLGIPVFYLLSTHPLWPARAFCSRSRPWSVRESIFYLLSATLHLKAQVRQPRVLSAFCRRRTDQHYTLDLASWWLQGASRLRRVGLSLSISFDRTKYS